MIIQAKSAVIAGELVDATWVEISGDEIRAVNSGLNPNPDQVIDGVLIPGFVDIHCHGGGGKYFSALTPGEVHSVIQTHRGHGTTSLFASLVTEPLETLKHQIEKLKPFVASGQIAGIHLEGPYLSHARCGAHDPSLLINPEISDLKDLLLIAQGSISMITIAPELPGAIEAITFLQSMGVRVALGHTDGGFKDAANGTNAGGTIITHFLNAMDKKLGEDTFASYVITDERLSIELILDGHHLPFSIAKDIHTAVGDRLIFVTDAMAAAGGIDGNYTIGKLPVIVKDSIARLESNGALAGSTLTMDTVFLNAINELGLSIPEAVAATSTRAAKRMGLSNCGDIAVGHRADLLEFNPGEKTITLI